ncbi:MAG: hypothetical protein Q4B12_06590 [Bowdeniella nasicola]|nr:hypothetical protein [Bowdeniella nasicola]
MYLAAKTPPAEVVEPAQVLLGWAAWLITLVFVAALLFVGGKAGYERYSAQETPTSMTRVVLILIGAIISSTAAAWIQWAM